MQPGSTAHARGIIALGRGIVPGLAAFFLISAAATAHAGDGVYIYTDNEGGVHLTNVPDDRRYSVLIPGALAARAALTAEGAAAPAGAAAAAANRSAADLAALLRSGAPRPYKTMVEQASARAGIDKALLHAVIAVESGYNPRAVSKKGAGGLMQLMPETAKRYKVANVFDPVQNVRGGAQYLADLLKLFDNNLHLALAAYNAGEAAVFKYGRRIPPYPETVTYVPKVIDYYGRLRLTM